MARAIPPGALGQRVRARALAKAAAAERLTPAQQWMSSGSARSQARTKVQKLTCCDVGPCDMAPAQA